MGNEDGSLQIVFNGEIYNYREIREELSAAGHRFASATDTEVILHAYEEWGGRDCLARFNGMWAFALWDGRRRELFCARDRLGVKPFYYTMAGGGSFLFASEIKALRVHPGGVGRRPNDRMLSTFLAWGGLRITPLRRCTTASSSSRRPIRSSSPRRASGEPERYWDFAMSGAPRAGGPKTRPPRKASVPS